MSVHHSQAPLSGVRALDMTRLAPGPYGSMLLADLGADVIVIGGGRSGLPVPALSRGKRFISLDLKTSAGRDALHVLVANADVLMEGFRPGVADRIGAGYDELRRINPQLVYCSVTGYGQDGPLAQTAGHDINYLSVSGALGTFGPPDGAPLPPLNLVADFAGGGLLAVFGIVSALFARQTTGTGSYIDAAMVDGVMSIMGMNFADWGGNALPRRGDGLLAGSAPFYRCYQCRDGRYVAVGALEVGFFRNLWTALGLGDVPDHFDTGTWPAIEKALSRCFQERSMWEWTDLLVFKDACVTPVLEPNELSEFDHIRSRHPGSGIQSVPVVPRFAGHSREPAHIDTTDVTNDVLAEFGIDAEAAERAMPVAGDDAVQGLRWPPL